MDKREYLRKWNHRNQDRVKAQRVANRDRRNAQRRAAYAASPDIRTSAIRNAGDYKRRNPLRRAATQYGVDVDRLELLMDRGCAVCGAGASAEQATRMHADHDHKTHMFRGVLCENCNHGIGKFYDDPVLLVAAAEYLMNGGCK